MRNATQSSFIDKKDLLRGFAFLLSALEQAAKVAVMEPTARPSVGDRGPRDGFGTQAEVEASAHTGPEALLDAPGTMLDNIKDSFTNYDESPLKDGRTLRNYEDGKIRLINPTSGVIQEERTTGKMLISLPNGKIIYQDNPGEPLLVYDTRGNHEPIIARVSLLRQATGSRYVYNFEDPCGTHLIDLETLEYFALPPGRTPRVRQNGLHRAHAQRSKEERHGDPLQPVR
jgi:hypothetical protein